MKTDSTSESNIDSFSNAVNSLKDITIYSAVINSENYVHSIFIILHFQI